MLLKSMSSILRFRYPTVYRLFILFFSIAVCTSCFECLLAASASLQSSSPKGTKKADDTVDNKSNKPVPISIQINELKKALASRDTDKNGRVTEAEFVAGVSKKSQPAARRDFRLFDRNADKTLSLQEFRTIPGLIPTALRAELPHPLTPLVEKQMVIIKKNWKQWDTDGNGTLSRKEFDAAKLVDQISGLAPSTWNDWDRDADGVVSQKDCRWLIEAGYGLRRLDGQQIQIPSGHVVYWWHFKELDLNKDDSLSTKEFLAYFKRFGVEEANKIFKRTDTDKNGQITLREWPGVSAGILIDTIAEFQKMDVSLDGQLNRKEYMDGVMPFLRPLARYMLPGFDMNRDGLLSLDEFRLTMPINRIENWDRTIQDTDHDGRLSLDELPWTPGLELSLLRQEYFKRLDLNKNGFLDYNEFKFTVDTKKAPPEVVLEAALASRDINKDGRVTEDEFVAAVAKAAQPAAKRDFRLFDRNADKTLSLQEFRTIPGLVPTALRTELPHPLTPLVEKQVVVIKKNWKQWDTDGNGTLSNKEFDAAKLTDQISELAPSTWEDWDRDADGVVSLEDCRWLIEAGYGLRRLNGQQIQLPSGHVVYWWHFKELDRDKDDTLSVKEFLAYYNRLGEEQAKKRFQQGDIDQDKRITLREWAKMPSNLLDPISEFRLLDKNLDGHLDHRELRNETASWLRPLTRYMFPGFDLDRNGLFSLDEYRLTLQANRVENWLAKLRDTNHDGRLSLTEFTWTPGVEQSLLYQEYFKRLDLNKNGFLDYNEFKFTVDPKKAPPEVVLQVALASRDINKDGRVTEDEFVAAVAKAAQPAAKRDFRLFDRDADKTLSLQEFRTIPGFVPTALRGELPHPLTPLIKKQMAVLEQGWKQWDTDGNGTLSRKEFDAAKLVDKISGLAPSTWEDWDRDADGVVSQKDCRWLIEAGYGLRRLDGQQIQLPSGLVIYWWHFKELDRDKDDRLSTKEFLAYFKRFGVEEANKIFKQADTDKNGQITLREWPGVSTGNLIDTIANFQKMDVSLDGQLDSKEYMDGVMPFLRPLARYMLPSFDMNQDGLLSLDEFRLTMPINRIENWDRTIQDPDHDGRLSLDELPWTPGLELSLLRQEYFKRLDLNSNGFLDFNEFKFTVDPKKAPPEVVLQVALASRDSDKDGQVTEAEYIAAVAKKSQPAAQRDFRLFDRDADNTLSLQEFSTIPGLIPTALRGELPHPLTPLVEKQMAVIKKNWKQWDTDGNGTLSNKEFDAAKLVDQIPGLAPSTRKDWDRDADGAVSQKDCRWLIEAGYGIRRLDGQQIQLPSGHVVYWWHFKNLDRDGDDGLTVKEFLAYYKRLGVVDAKKRFVDADTDNDGRMTLQEWPNVSGNLLDPIAEFLSLDVNLDGKVNQRELQEKTAAWLHPLSRYSFPGFDLDKDKALSLDEYRLTLPANRVEDWLSSLSDTNHDGRLSLSEFSWTSGLELSLLRQEYFKRLDLNKNGFLDYNEFKFTVDPKKAPPEVVLQVALASRDSDKDGQVTEAEFVAAVNKAAQPAAQRDFRLFDRNGDKTLSLQEFRTIPGLIPTALRGELPHPLTPLIEKQMAVIEQGWKQWDTDENGTLSNKEFDAAKLVRQIPGLALSTWKDWDRDADGAVSREDCRWLIEAGYGLRRLDGQLVQLPSGLVIYWWHFKGLDRDGDDSLTLEEFLTYYKKQGEEEAKKRFQQGDTDKDGRITLREWPNLSGSMIDTIADFQKMDVSLDGRIDHKELMDGVMPFLRPLAQYMLPGFDLDQDGHLSLDEYRMTLPVNRVENWLVKSRDSDRDGRLSLTELAWTSGLELSLLRQEYFNRLDVNDNGFLDYNEYQFIVDLNHVPLKILFNECDKNNDSKLTLAEFLEVEKDSGKIKLDGSNEPRVMRIEEAYYRADVNGDKYISLAEFDTDAGKQIVAPDMSFKTKNRNSMKASQVTKPEGESDNFMTLVLLANVILVMGVVAYLFHSHLKKVKK